jgi:hypothetical protein
MAEVSSSGGSMNTRRSTDRSINQPVINSRRAFYYIELDVPDGANIEVLGFQIAVKETC